MKERPIIFSAPMVRAILAGTKTQTRRAVKGAPYDWQPRGPELFAPTVVDRHGDEQPGADVYGAGNEDGSDWIRCPHGKPGDRLWVRETHQFDAPCDGTWPHTSFYGCKGAPLDLIPERFRHPRFMCYRADWLHGEILWRPAIHMPRWASRIWLEVTEVRVERLQDISEADAIAEGVDRFPGCRQDDDAAAFNRIGPVDNDSFPIARYAALWESINGPSSWDANPWIWSISFRRVTP